MRLCDVINGFFHNVKGNSTSHDAVDKSSSKQQICDSASIVFMVRTNWTHILSANGSYGKLAGRQHMGGFGIF